MKAFMDPNLLSWTVVFHHTFDPWNQPCWEKETLIRLILPIFVLCSNSYTRILDRCSSSYASMTSKFIEGITYDISRNPTRTIRSNKVSPTRDITHKLCVYDLATWFNRKPVSLAAIVIASYCAPFLNIIVLLRIHTAVKVHYWSINSTSLSVLDDNCLGIQLAEELTYSLY